MGTKFVVGNLLDDATVTMTPAADSLFPESFLHDGPGQMGGRFGSLAADSEVRVSFASAIPYADGDGPGAAPALEIADNFFEPDIPTAWYIEQGLTPASDQFSVLLILSGALSAVGADHGGNDWVLGVLPGPTDFATAKLDEVCRAGVTYFVNGWCVNESSASGGAAIRVFDRTNGLYLKPDGTWAASVQSLVVDNTLNLTWLGINAGAGVSFTMPSADALGAEQVDVELQLIALDGQSTLFDDLVFQAQPAADFLMIAGGHNIQAAAGPILWQTSANGSSWTTRATLTQARHQFWALLAAPVTAAYHRLLFDGTPTLKMWMGDVVLGLSVTLPRTPMEKVDITYQETGQARLATPGGTEHVSNRGPYPPRTLRLSHRFRTAAEEVAARAILIDGLRGGEVPAVMMPSTLHFPGLAVYGRLEQSIDFSMATHGMQLAGSSDEAALEHYSDMTLTFREGPGFTLD